VARVQAFARQAIQDILRQLAIGRDDRLRAGAVAVVAGLALPGLEFLVMSQFGRQHALGQLLPELAGQSRFAENRLGIPVLRLSQQLIDQFIRKQLRRTRFLALLRHVCCFGHKGVPFGIV